MNNLLRIFIILLGQFTVCTVCPARPVNSAGLQAPSEEKIYTIKEVDVIANIKNRLEHLPERKSDCPNNVQVTLRIVLHKSGKVTDIRVLKASGCSYDQEAIKAVQVLKFGPALKDGQPVSQYLEIEYKTTLPEWPVVGVATQTSAGTALRYSLLIAQSNSLKEHLQHVTAAAQAVISANSTSDETAVVRFIDPARIETLQDFTSDKVKLMDCINGLRNESGQTAIIDALYLSAQALLQNAPKQPSRFRLVLITDGDEGGSYYKFDVLLSALRQYRIPVYILAYVNSLKGKEGAKRYEKAIAFINKLAKESGGAVVFADNPKDIEGKAPEVVRLLQGG